MGNGAGPNVFALPEPMASETLNPPIGNSCCGFPANDCTYKYDGKVNK